MDREDLDHFRTIQNQSAAQSTPKSESSASPRDLDWYQTQAKIICGCYRRDEAQDPETFAAALAAVLADYPEGIVTYAADPRTGVITKFPMGLPNIGQIKQFLDDAVERQDRLNRYAARPKPARAEVFDKPPPTEPNLFVPDTSSRYGALAKRAEREPARARFGSKVCKDGVRRTGVVVPLHWWEEPATLGDDVLAKAAQTFLERACREGGIDPCNGVSPALMANIREHTSQEASNVVE